MLTVSDPNLLASRLEEPAACAVSVLTLNAGWPEDLRRLASALAATSAGVDYELLAAANASAQVAGTIEDLAAADGRVRGLAFTQHVGFGAARTAALGQARGQIVVIADTSVEPTGDALGPLAGLLEDPGVGLVGRWGLRSTDLRDFQEIVGGEVDALQAYWMACRREDARTVGGFDPKFKFYRNADIDWSLRWRAAGYRLVAADLPLERHAHREWEALSPDDRERKSRDNFARLLRTWRDRTDLLVHGSRSAGAQGAQQPGGGA
ncbi:MAG TPA: glycosyltransferase [Actinomycetota bacterium]|nr:glycosyltransferase [Actinomycetota bacterium]